jgi:hypothetical protein
MPAKRYLLIAFVALAAGLSAQQVSAWSNSAAYHYRSLFKEHLTGYNTDNTVTADWDNYTLELDNRFSYTDRKTENRQERLHDRLQLSLEHRTEHTYLKLFGRSEWFDKQYGWILPNGEFMPYLEDRSAQAGISGSLDLDRLEAFLNARYRSYAFSPVFDFIPTEVEGEYLKADAEVAYNFYKPLSVFISGYQKAALDDKYGDYDAASIGAGLRLQADITPIQHLEMQSGIDWIDSDAISADRLIPITSRARYSRMLTPSLTGFASYEIRNFYDQDKAEMLFNSQFLRASGKYTLGYDLSHGSFLELGGKLSPRGNVTRKSSALFTHAELRLVSRLYLGGGINHMPDRYTHYEALARYYLTPLSEVYIDYVYSDDTEHEDYTTYTAAGLRLVF